MQSFDQELELLVIAAIREDVGEGDHSTLSTIPEGSKGKAVLKIKDKGVLAGVAVAEKIFHILDPQSTFQFYRKDGDDMIFGDIAFDLYANIHTILKGERLVLNVMQR